MNLLLLILCLPIIGCIQPECSQCKYFTQAKYQLNKNGLIQLIPEKCKLFVNLHVDQQHIVQDNLETSICRKYGQYCGKNGAYFTLKEKHLE